MGGVSCVIRRKLCDRAEVVLCYLWEPILSFILKS